MRLPRHYRRRRQGLSHHIMRLEWAILLGIIGSISVALVAVLAWRTGDRAAALYTGVWAALTVALLLAAYLCTFAAVLHLTRVGVSVRRSFRKEHLDYERRIALSEAREQATAEEHTEKDREIADLKQQIEELNRARQIEPALIANLRNQVATLERRLLAKGDHHA